MTKIIFVCHGNICRSTMAESVFNHMIKTENIEDQFLVNSSATSREEIGNPVHHGTVRKLQSLNIPVTPHRATQITEKDFEEYDYIIAMDENNMGNLKRMGAPMDKTSKLLEFAGSTRDIADPWYTGNFDETYEDIEKGLNGLLDHLRQQGIID